MCRSFRLAPGLLLAAFLLLCAEVPGPAAAGSSVLAWSTGDLAGASWLPAARSVLPVTAAASYFPGPRPRAIAISSGELHSCAITDAGGVKCWGNNKLGQLGNGTDMDSGAPVDVIGLTSGVTSVATGKSHSCAVTSSGALKCWGLNGSGQLGRNPPRVWDGVPGDVTGLGSGVVSVAAGWLYTCAVMAGGGVKCWGNNEWGQLGDGTGAGRSLPADVIGLSGGAVRVSAGLSHACAVMVSGGVRCWGSNHFGQLGRPMMPPSTAAGDVVGLAGSVVSVAAGAFHTCAVTDARAVQCWGSNEQGQLGDGTINPRETPTMVSGLASGATGVSAYRDHTCAVTTAGGVMCWGENATAQLGDGTTAPRTTPVHVLALPPTIVAAATGGDHTCALTAAGAVRCWGDNSRGQAGDGIVTYRAHDVVRAGVGNVALSMTGTSACTVTSEGAIKCWGDNTTGALSDGVPWTASGSAVRIDAVAAPVKGMAAGAYHACALTRPGGVECWGDNTFGQLGDGTTNHRHARAAPVAGLTSGVVGLVAGDCHTCAVTGQGAVKCWGCNPTGQLGDGTTTDRWTPVEVKGLSSGVVALAAGGTKGLGPWTWNNHTCALTAAGGVKCWGVNWSGELGDGTRVDSPVPVGASGLDRGVVAIGAGLAHTCAVTASGVKCWGENMSGQLGVGYGGPPRPTPSDVIGLPGGIVAVAGGGNDTCVVAAGGGVECWGDNMYGQLGDGTTEPRFTPFEVPGLQSGVVALAAAGLNTCVLTNEGGVKCFGHQHLGDGRMSLLLTARQARLIGPPVSHGDFSGDGAADYAVFRPSSGEWLVAGGAGGAQSFGSAGDIPVVGDYDGDGVADEAFYRPSEGTWHVKDVALAVESAVNVCDPGGAGPCDQSQASSGLVQFGAAGDVPVPADYDADGWTDIAVWRPSTGAWLVRGSASRVALGERGDVPVPADYDADGRADFAVFRPWTATWYVRDIGTWTFGEPGDVPLPADYDGDGKADLAVFRPSAGSVEVHGQGSWQIGAEGNVLMALDVDADGGAEIVAYRPSTATWYSIDPATGSTGEVVFGIAGDVAALARPALPAPPLAGLPLVDFSGDGIGDILRYHPQNGDWAVGHGRWLAGAPGGSWSRGWTVKAADFDRDLFTDIFVYNRAHGWWYVCLNDGVGGWTYHGGTWSPGWDVEVLDLDGDLRSDVFVYNGESGLYFQCLTRGAGVFEYHGGRWSPGWNLYPARFDAGETDDLFVYDPVNGYWYQCLSDGEGSFKYAGGRWSPGWTMNVFDWTGDQRSDVFVYDKATGSRFSCANAGAGRFDCGVVDSWSPGWDVYQGDFDGDGRGDLFVYDPSSGLWFTCIMRADGTFAYQGGQWSVGWKIEVADVTGDARADVIVYNPANGDFFLCETLTAGSFWYGYRNFGPGWQIVSSRWRGGRMSR